MTHVKVSRGAATKFRTAAIPTPATHTECNLAIARIGELRRALDETQVGLDAQIAAAKKTAEEWAQPLKAELGAALKGVQAYCEAHRAELCPGKAKSFDFPAGQVSWRIKPPRVSIARKAVDMVLQALLGHRRWAKFVRTKHEIDKEALLKHAAEAATIPYVEIVTGEEEFIVAPAGMQLADAPTDGPDA